MEEYQIVEVFEEGAVVVGRFPDIKKRNKAFAIHFEQTDRQGYKRTGGANNDE